MTKANESQINRGSGNVFSDLEYPDADIYQLKADLVTRICDVVRRRKLTLTEIAELLELSQSDVSRLLRGRFREHSIERLLRLLNALGCDVEIIIREPKAPRLGRLRICTA